MAATDDALGYKEDGFVHSSNQVQALPTTDALNVPYKNRYTVRITSSTHKQIKMRYEKIKDHRWSYYEEGRTHHSSKNQRNKPKRDVRDTDL